MLHILGESVLCFFIYDAQSIIPELQCSCLQFLQEIKFEPTVMCERLDKRASFRFSQVFLFYSQPFVNISLSFIICLSLSLSLSQIEDGDIICFQKRPLPENEEQARFPDVPSYLEYVKNRQVSLLRCFCFGMGVDVPWVDGGIVWMRVVLWIVSPCVGCVECGRGVCQTSPFVLLCTPSILY